jgi:CRISPR/Cas system CSM-associated protein Csm3 (group 7 of RAMP superfamily)
VSKDEVDADFAGKDMVMHVRECSETRLRIPFHIDDDHSRTWVISKTDNGLRLKHDHRHKDGLEDAVTQYGGDTIYDGAISRQVFPVDQFSIDMFEREGLTASVENIWAVEINNATFAYELSRPNRHFRVEFDVTKPVDTPPTPWGFED